MISRKKLLDLFPLTPNEVITNSDSPERTIREWLSLFSQVIGEYNIPIYLLYGTCLGIIRDQDIIPHDTDIDIGIKEDDFLKLSKAVKKLESLGFFITSVARFTIRFELKGVPDGLDLWTIEQVKNPFVRLWGYKWLCDHVYYKQDYFSDSDSVIYDKNKYYVPSPVTNYLEGVFGKSWTVLIKDFYAGPRGLLSQWLSKPFVDFDVPMQFSGSRGVYKPWVSRVIKRFFSKTSLMTEFKHPD